MALSFKTRRAVCYNSDMSIDKGLVKIGDLIKNKAKRIAPPVYVWQELALRVIEELGIPGFKRSAVFKVCKQLPEFLIKKALNDTKELCRTGAKWKYFFKIIADGKKK
jgi:hypothetical protein